MTLVGPPIVLWTGERGIPDVAQRAKMSVSRKGLAAVAFLVFCLPVRLFLGLQLRSQRVGVGDPVS